MTQILGESGDALASSRNRGIDFGLRMRGGNEESFVLGGRQKDAPAEHFLEKPSEPRGIRFFGVRVIFDRTLSEENGQQRSRNVDDTGNSRVVQGRFKSIRKPLRFAIQIIVETKSLQLREHGEART